MKNSEIGIGGDYIIGTSKDAAPCAHEFRVGELVTINERVLKSGFSAQSYATGKIQFIEAKDIHSVGHKDRFNTTVDRETAERIARTAKVCRHDSAGFVEAARITSGQWAEINQAGRLHAVKTFYDIV